MDRPCCLSGHDNEEFVRKLKVNIEGGASVRLVCESFLCSHSWDTGFSDEPLLPVKL